MSIFFLDTVTITPRNIDETYGSDTIGIAFDSKAYVEDEDRIERGVNGAPTQAIRFIMLPYGVQINKGDFVSLKKRSGIVVNGTDSVRREIVSVAHIRGVSISHLEVKTKSAGR